jgi:hypothetical protein
VRRISENTVKKTVTADFSKLILWVVQADTHGQSDWIYTAEAVQMTIREQ